MMDALFLKVKGAGGTACYVYYSLVCCDNPRMLMMCWFYCVPFAKSLFFAAGPLLMVFALFALKRGIRRSRPTLRQFSFVLMFAALLKICTVDIYMSRDVWMCAFSECHDAGFYKLVQGAGLAVLVLGGFFLLNLYRSFAHDKRQREVTAEQAHLRFWSGLSLTLVMVLILWLAAPWAGYLTVGHAPEFFAKVPWQFLALLNVIVLLYGFWKLEDCVVIPQGKDRRKSYRPGVWTAKDTLWVSAVLLLIAVAFSYASEDVLSTAMPEAGSHLQINLNDIDFDSVRPPGFKPLK